MASSLPRAAHPEMDPRPARRAHPGPREQIISARPIQPGRASPNGFPTARIPGPCGSPRAPPPQLIRIVLAGHVQAGAGHHLQADPRRPDRHAMCEQQGEQGFPRSRRPHTGCSPRRVRSSRPPATAVQADRRAALPEGPRAEGATAASGPRVEFPGNPGVQPLPQTFASGSDFGTLAASATSPSHFVSACATFRRSSDIPRPSSSSRLALSWPGRGSRRLFVAADHSG